MAVNYNAYSGNNDFRGFLAANLPSALSYTGNDGGVNPNAFATYAKGTGKVLGNTATDVRVAQDPNWNNTLAVTQAAINNLYNNWQNAQKQQPAPSGGGAYSGGGGGGGGYASSGGGASPAQDISFLSDQAAQLRALLGRTDTGLAQGLTQNDDQYNTQVGAANNSKQQQYANYADQRVSQNKGKLSAYDTINKNAGNGYRSLAQIIGRSAGTGSSAFNELLPNVVGKDTSSKRQAATDTYGQNLAGIDKAQGQYDISFAGVLNDLLKQKRDNENTLRTGIEGQRQNINQQLNTNAGQLAQAKGGGYAQVKAAQAPFQAAIDNSRNTVESFFNQFRTPYTPTQAVAPTPDMTAYNIDRSTVNAQQDPSIDPNNPYSALLRKKLQGQSGAVAV